MSEWKENLWLSVHEGGEHWSSDPPTIDFHIHIYEVKDIDGELHWNEIEHSPRPHGLEHLKSVSGHVTEGFVFPPKGEKEEETK